MVVVVVVANCLTRSRQMDPEKYERVLEKIERMPKHPDAGKVYVRKDGVIVKSMLKKKSSQIHFKPVCTICLEANADVSYDELCSNVKMKQHIAGVKQGPSFFVCSRHSNSKDSRIQGVRRGRVDPEVLKSAKKEKLAWRRSYKCILCPGPLSGRKEGQFTLQGLFCHKCFFEALKMSECPKWIQEMKVLCKMCRSIANLKTGVCSDCNSVSATPLSQEYLAGILKHIRPRKTSYELKIEGQRMEAFLTSQGQGLK